MEGEGWYLFTAHEGLPGSVMRGPYASRADAYARMLGMDCVPDDYHVEFVREVVPVLGTEAAGGGDR